MTEAEKKEIVALVMSEISGQAVDFDLQTVTPQRTDILPAVRPDGAGGYTGVTLDWGGITDELTTQAKEFRNEALQAKKDTELLKGETNAIKSDVEDIYRQFNEAVDKTIESVRNVYQSDLNAESTARQTADNTLQQNIDSEASTRAEADTAIGARIDSETTTRESEVAELERVNAIQKYEIENLKAKAEGKIYREEIIEANAYKLDVPSSVSPYAEVQKIKGKSVVWSQLEGSSKQNIYSDHYYIYIADTEVLEDKTNIYFYMRQVGYTQNNQAVMGPYNIGNYRLYWKTRPAKGTSTEGDYDILVLEGKAIISNKMLIDLTQIFGSGNEPTEEECKKIFSAEYYPFDAGTIKSFPLKTVRSVNAEGTEIGSIDISSVTSDLKSAGSVHDEWENGKKIKRVGERAYTSGDESESNYITDGTTTYYPLDTPIEETVPEIDNYINVEGGGILTFESDDAVHMPVPSTDRFVVDLTSTTEEETT